MNCAEVEDRLMELFETGCPGCGNKKAFFVDCTELVRRNVWINSRGVEWGQAEFIDELSNDFIVCPDCEWEEYAKTAQELGEAAQGAVRELEEMGEADELKVLLGYVKKAVKIVDPDYDVTRDPDID